MTLELIAIIILSLLTGYRLRMEVVRRREIDELVSRMKRVKRSK